MEGSSVLPTAYLEIEMLYKICVLAIIMNLIVLLLDIAGAGGGYRLVIEEYSGTITITSYSLLPIMYALLRMTFIGGLLVAFRNLGKVSPDRSRRVGFYGCIIIIIGLVVILSVGVWIAYLRLSGALTKIVRNMHALQHTLLTLATVLGVGKLAEVIGFFHVSYALFKLGKELNSEIVRIGAVLLAISILVRFFASTFTIGLFSLIAEIVAWGLVGEGFASRLGFVRLT